MMEAVATHSPGLLPLISYSYGTPSSLWLGEEILTSDEGVQQGDPLGPLLFSLTLHLLLSGHGDAFVCGYLDDVGMGDKVSDLVSHVHTLEKEAKTLGFPSIIPSARS